MFTLRRIALLLTAILLGSGCDTTDTGTDPREDDLFEPGCDLATAINVRPKGTYLRFNDDDPDDPTIVRLADVGVSPGMTLVLERFGEYQYRINSDPSDVRREMAAVFSSSNTLLGGDQRARVPGALDAGEDFTSRPSLSDRGVTNIPEDFEVGDSTVVTVPTGAAYLFVGPPDDRFRDNADEDDDYRICITEAN